MKTEIQLLNIFDYQVDCYFQIIYKAFVITEFKASDM